MKFRALMLTVAAALLAVARPLSADDPVVRAVLFFSPYCPHCHEVMREDLPPLLERYGERLRVLTLDVTHPEGRRLYLAAARHFRLSDDQLVVPLLVIGRTVLEGGEEIPARLPALVSAGLAAGGIDWPAVPGLRETVAAWDMPGAEVSGASVDGRERPAGASALGGELGRRFALDPVGNSLSVVVLLTLVVVVGLAVSSVLGRGPRVPSLPSWTIPVLVLVGLGIAGYMTFVETTPAEAVCGPVGDCNAVQQSEYAYLFGVIPVGALGVGGYLAIGAAWLLAQTGSGRQPSVGAGLVFGLTLAGALFSIYLTFLEPFVIGATCVWCLNSAIVMTLLLIAASGSEGLGYDAAAGHPTARSTS